MGRKRRRARVFNQVDQVERHIQEGGKQEYLMIPMSGPVQAHSDIDRALGRDCSPLQGCLGDASR